MGVFKIETFFQFGNNLVPPEVGRDVLKIRIVKVQLGILHKLFFLSISVIKNYIN